MARTSKTFRIFVSSTFNDLKKERNALQELVFPVLRERCMQHGCRFQAIDLRWGVAEEASHDQQTMKICLEEIARCQRVTPKPNFIILLGDRYGWRPLPWEIPAEEFERMLTFVDESDKDILAKWYLRDDNAVSPVYDLQPLTGAYRDREIWAPIESRLKWILEKAAMKCGVSKDSLSRYISSATEQEITRGAMNSPDAMEHVFCFFRKIRGLPHDNRSRDFEDLMEVDTALQVDMAAKRRLRVLKDEKLRSSFPDNVFDYEAVWTEQGITTGHIDQLCSDVLNSLWKVIEAEIRGMEEIDHLERGIFAHEAFGQERREYFTGRRKYLDKISEYISRDDRHPLAIFGESGTGKTALMAEAVKEARESGENAVVVHRFIGATAESSDIRSLLESICREITRAYDMDESIIPSDYSEIVQGLPERLGFAIDNRKLIVFIDAFDQLSETNNARGLSWLPFELPVNVRMVVSTLPGDCLKALEENRPETERIELKPMPEFEGNELLRKWLQAEGRSLQDHQMQEALNRFSECRLPFFLKLVFDEVKRWKSYNTETKLSPNVKDAINYLFNRLSAESNHGRELVARSLGYLVASKNGLSEDELLDILSADEIVMNAFFRRSPNSPPIKSLPPIVWSRLYFDMEPYLTERIADEEALMSLYHRQISEAIIENLISEEIKIDLHKRLAAYYSNLPLLHKVGEEEIPNLRKLSELPHGLLNSQQWDTMVDLLFDLDFLKEAFDRTEDDLNMLWHLTQKETGRDLVEEVKSLIREADASVVQLDILGILLWSQGELEVAMECHKKMGAYWRCIGDDISLSTSLGNQALIHQAWGEFDKALKLYKDQEKICREQKMKELLGMSLLNQSSIHLHRGELERCLELIKKLESLQRDQEHINEYQQKITKQTMIAALNNKAMVNVTLGEYHKALDCLKESENMCRETDGKYRLSISLGNQALIYKAWGELDKAMELHKEEERICRELGNKDGLSSSLGNQANFHFLIGELDKAMELHKEVDRICRELGNKDGLSSSLGNQALIYKAWGELDKAMELHKEKESICRELGNKEGLSSSLGNQANFHFLIGELDKAMELHKEGERICRELGNKDGLSTSLGNQALIHRTRGELDKAMELHKEEERICRELGNKDGLSTSLGNQALIHRTRGELDKAMELHKEEERICRELGNKDGLSTSLGNQALIHQARGELDKAMELHKEEERICRELGNKESLARSLGNQAIINYAFGDLDKAMSLMKEQERFYTELGLKYGLQSSLGNQAAIHRDKGEFTIAMELHQEKESLCRELGLKEGLASSLANQAVILAHNLSRPNEGLPLAKEALEIAEQHGYKALTDQIRPRLEKIEELCAKEDSPQKPKKRG